MEVALLMVWLQLQACRSSKMSNASQARATIAVQAVRELVQGLQDGRPLEAVRDCLKRLGREVQELTDTSGEGVRLAAVSFLR